MERRRGAVLILVATLVAAFPALAHRMNLFALAEGPEIRGTVTFAGGGRGANLPVRIEGPDGSPLAEARTDAQGNFAFTATRRQDHRLSVDTEDGHGARFLVRAEELPASLPEGPSAPSIPPPAVQDLEAVVARQIAPLRMQIEAYEQRIRWHDVLGGIGYILGLAGIAFFLLGRRPRP
jgi:nickel transport protein